MSTKGRHYVERLTKKCENPSCLNILTYKKTGVEPKVCSNKCKWAVQKGKPTWNKDKHYSKPKKITVLVECKWCRKSFEDTITEGTISERKYCSNECQFKHFHATHASPTKGMHIVPRITKKCADKDCTNLITIKVSDDKKYCSQKCSQKNIDKTKFRKFSKFPIVKTTCQNENCSKEITYRSNDIPPQYCSNYCSNHSKKRANKISETKMKQFLSGEQSPSVNAKFKSGHYHSEILGQYIFHRSSYEYDYIRQKEQDVTVKSILSEKIRIPYVNLSGKVSVCIVDFLVEYKDGSLALVEIKPKFKLKYRDQLLKIYVSFHWAKLNNIPYHLITEDDLYKSVTTKFSEVIQEATIVAEEVQQRYSLSPLVIVGEKQK